MGDLRLHLCDQILLGLVSGKAGDALQHLGLAALDEPDLLLLTVGGSVLGGQRLFLLLDLLCLMIEVFFLLLQTALLLLQVGAAFLDFLLVFSSGAQDLLLCLHQCFAFLTLGILDGLVDDAQGFLLGALDLALVALGLLPVDQNTSEDAKTKRRGSDQHRVYDLDHGFLPLIMVYPDNRPPSGDKQGWGWWLSIENNRMLPLNHSIIILHNSTLITVNCQEEKHTIVENLSALGKHFVGSAYICTKSDST